MKTVWITTSWDDGHRLDLRLAALLDKYDLVGTFYVARDYLPERLTEAEIIELTQRHEIGGHTITHRSLVEMSLDDARYEVAESKQWLEKVIKAPITSFCYPRGHYNGAVREIVAEAGYEMARTVEQYSFGKNDHPLEMPTTIHIYPFPFRPVNSIRAYFEPIQRVVPHVYPLRIPLLALRSWTSLAISLLERAAAIGGVWHLWGHSWEIEYYQMWEALEKVLAATQQYPHARRVTNSQLSRERHMRA
jgi:hypothetical protein